MKRQGVLITALATGATLTVGAWVEARRAGAPAAFNGSIASGGRTCTECHDPDGVGAGTVEILGAPAQYALGERYSLRVRVSDPDQFGAGFELSVEDANGRRAGDLVLTDAIRTRYAGSTTQWVTHTEDGADDSVLNWSGNGFAYEYPVEWVAPTSDLGTVTFFAAGNAIDDDGSTVGDNVYLAQSGADRAPTDCGAVNSLAAKCKDGTFKVVGKVKTSLAEGRALLLSLDGGAETSVVINRRGKGKANWRNVAGGEHTVCVVDCETRCSSTSCNP
ncbi:MAG: hypothetical protein BroJett003_06770 [Planctomycetota bacterium]|nr:MAG: hypothetical protein BroJett003_06770 [Planctomycetota bacterium]